MGYSVKPLLWRQNGRHCVSNHQPHDCLLNRSFRHRSKKTSKLRVTGTGLCAGNSPVIGKFLAQMASNAQNVSIWWRHHAGILPLRSDYLMIMLYCKYYHLHGENNLYFLVKYNFLIAWLSFNNMRHLKILQEDYQSDWLFSTNQCSTPGSIYPLDFGISHGIKAETK